VNIFISKRRTRFLLTILPFFYLRQVEKEKTSLKKQQFENENRQGMKAV